MIMYVLICTKLIAEDSVFGVYSSEELAKDALKNASWHSQAPEGVFILQKIVLDEEDYL